MISVFESRLELGKMYKDPRTEIEGIATILCFSSEGCVEAMLEHSKKGKRETTLFNELRLVTPDDASLESSVHEYEVPLVLNREYRDIQTGLQGHLAIVEVHEFMPTRGVLRHVSSDNKGRPDLSYHSIDYFLLEDVETEQVPERTEDRRSPVTHKVDYR